MIKRVRLIGCMSLCVWLWSFCVFATQFLPPRVLLQLDVSPSDHQVKVIIINEENEPIEMRIWQGDLSRVKLPILRAHLDSQEAQTLILPLEPISHSLTHLHLQSEVTLLHRKISVAGPQVFEVFKKWGSRFKNISYSDAYLSQRVSLDDSDIEARLPCEQGACQDLFFRTQPIGNQSVSLNDQVSDLALREGESRSSQYSLSPQLESPRESSSVMTEVGPKRVEIQGRLFFKVRAQNYRPAEKMRVSAWVLIQGKWKKLGSAPVKADGSWFLVGPQGFLGQRARVVYQTQNEFFTLNDPSHRPYSWTDEWFVLQEKTLIGARFIDLTLEGNLPGLDELYLGALQLWSKFQSIGISLLRSSPIEVVFPNSLSTNECIFNNGHGAYPWSCSYWQDGKIYIIPAHANRSVIQHELAHSIHSSFWGGRMPSGAGGAHNLWECFHPGLALTEGFADFIAYWSQYDRQAQDPRIEYFNMSIETLPEGVCAQPGSEMRVASTFWDLYDAQIDGRDPESEFDQVMSLDLRTPIQVFLNSPKNSMPEYLKEFEKSLSFPNPTELIKVFRLNKMLGF